MCKQYIIVGFTVNVESKPKSLKLTFFDLCTDHKYFLPGMKLFLQKTTSYDNKILHLQFSNPISIQQLKTTSLTNKNLKYFEILFIYI